MPDLPLSLSPIEAYRALVASGALDSDPDQALAVEMLQILHRRLIDYDPAARSSLLTRIGLARRDPPPVGIYLYGGVGRGKSMLMDLFFARAPTAPKRRVHFNAFMLEVHAAIFAFRQRSKEERQQDGLGDDPIPPVAAGIARDAVLLCFDEFQVTDVADAMILSRLFTALFDVGVVVVATSNRAPDELYLGGLNRPLFLPFIDLIKQRLDVLHLDGRRDYRRHRIVGKPVYFTPLNAESDAACDAAFRALTDADRGTPVTLEVQGRQVEIPEVAKGVARASFAQLCSAALGAADYLALVDLCHTLILDRIPQMDESRRNEAKRFVLLVDSLYEAKRRLICSAAVPPPELYVKGDGSFEFARTASRLEEMQSAAWLAE